MMTFFAPAIDSKVRRIRSSRAGVRTWVNCEHLGERHCVGSHLDPNIIRDLSTFNQPSHEAKVRVTGSRICDLNLLEPATEEVLKEHSFLTNGHRIRKGLVSITQVGRKPDWSFVYFLRRPSAVIQFERSVWFVLDRRICSGNVGVCVRRDSSTSNRRKGARNTYSMHIVAVVNRWR